MDRSRGRLDFFEGSRRGKNDAYRSGGGPQRKARGRLPHAQQALGTQEISSDQQKEARHKSQLKTFYRDVIQKIEKSDRIFIYGPGEAKIELRKEMAKKSGLTDKIAKFETADKMTENQFVAMIKKDFE